MARRLAAQAALVGPASCQGRLYLVAHYPGIVASDDPADRVIGEVYRLGESALLDALDDYEGCGAGDPPPHEFVRRRHPVRCGGRAFDAWVYFYTGSVAGLPRIASGDFLRHVGESR